MNRNEEIEEGLIATCVALGRVAVKRIDVNLEPVDFFNQKHKVLWGIIKRLYLAGDEIDVLILVDALMNEQKELLSNYFPILYARSISNYWFNCTPVHVNTYAKKIKEYSVSRRSALTMKGGVYKIETTQDADEVNTGVINTLSSLKDELSVTEVRGIGDSYDSAITELIAKMSGDLKVVNTGIEAVDSKIGGFYPGEFIIVAGRPSMGKSDVAMNIARNNAMAGVKAQFQSLEMNNAMAMFRLLSLETGVFRNKYRSGTLSSDDLIVTQEAKERILKLSLSLIAPGQITLSKIRSLAIEERAKNGLQLLVIDYIGYIIAERGKNREQEVATISKGLKYLAQELNIPLICVSQLSRAAEIRDNPIPQLSDLRESGSIEQDCDIAIFPFRESYYENRKKNKNNMIETDPQNDHLDLYVLKHRNGETCVIKDVSYNRGTGHIGMGEGHIIRVEPLQNTKDYPDDWDE